MEFIGNTLFPAIDKSIISKMVAFNNKVGRYFVCGSRHNAVTFKKKKKKLNVMFPSTSEGWR